MPAAQPPSQSSPFKAWIPVVSVIILLGAACGEKMPDLVKQPYAEGVGSLDSTAFVITRVDTLADTIDYGRGVIVSQSIPAGSKLKGDSNVLILTVQEDFAVVPDLTGSDDLKAVQLLSAAGLDYNRQAEPTTARMPDEGKVVRSDPVSGTLVKSGTTVTFFVRTFGRPCIGLRCLVVLDTALLRRTWEQYRRRVP